MEAKDQEAVKESRTQKLLRQLKVGADFGDSGLPTGYFSHSQYVSWKICGKAYEFKYVKKMRNPGSPQMAKGTAVHAGIEFMLINKRLGNIPTLAQAEAVVSDVFEKQVTEVPDWGEDDEGRPIEPGHIKDRAVELLRTFAKHALPKINPIAIEEGFAVKLGGVPMIGWIDLVDAQPALIVPSDDPDLANIAPLKHVTVDFKTGRAKWSENELRTDTQMTLYATVRGTPHVRVDQLLDMKKGAVYVQGHSTRTPEDSAVLVDDLNEVVDFIKRGIFPSCSIDSWACTPKHCAYYGECRGKKR